MNYFTVTWEVLVGCVEVYVCVEVSVETRCSYPPLLGSVRLGFAQSFCLILAFSVRHLNHLTSGPVLAVASARVWLWLLEGFVSCKDRGTTYGQNCLSRSIC